MPNDRIVFIDCHSCTESAAKLKGFGIQIIPKFIAIDWQVFQRNRLIDKVNK